MFNIPVIDVRTAYDAGYLVGTVEDMTHGGLVTLCDRKIGNGNTIADTNDVLHVWVGGNIIGTLDNEPLEGHIHNPQKFIENVWDFYKLSDEQALPYVDKWFEGDKGEWWTVKICDDATSMYGNRFNPVYIRPTEKRTYVHIQSCDDGGYNAFFKAGADVEQIKGIIDSFSILNGMDMLGRMAEVGAYEVECY